MSSDMPLVSVVMAVRNEAAFIERSLGTVLAQDYPADRLEVLVVDGRSDDGTPEIVRRMDGANGRAALESEPARPSVRLLDNPGRIVPTGVNAALRVARGDVIMRIDGHCELPPNYVRRCVEALNREQVDVVGGPWETVGETFPARAIAIAMSSRFGVGGSHFRVGSEQQRLVDTVPLPAYTRGAIRRAGLFDEELVRDQDEEYSYRLRELGLKILLDPSIRSRYWGRTSFRSLWRQYLQYGFWKVRVFQRHPRQMQLRHFVPPAFVIALVASVALAAATPVGWVALAAVGGSYLLANAVAALSTAARTRWRYVPLLSWTYLVLHLSYGLGFLAGLVRFANRWGDKIGKTPKPSPTGVWAER